MRLKIKNTTSVKILQPTFDVPKNSRLAAGRLNSGAPLPAWQQPLNRARSAAKRANDGPTPHANAATKTAGSQERAAQPERADWIASVRRLGKNGYQKNGHNPPLQNREEAVGVAPPTRGP